jgi:hypothetical protein
MKRRKTDGGETQETEDELPEFRRKREERLKKLHKRRKMIVTLVILGLVTVFAAFNWDKLAPASLADNIQGLFGEFGSGGYPLMISSGNFKNAVPIGSNIGVLTDTSVLIYSQAGTELTQRQHGMSNPTIDAAGGKAVVYDRGGKTFKVETRFDEPFAATTAFPIVTAAMSLSGRLAVVTQSDSYLSELMVYDTGYKNIFKWYSSKGYITAASLSPDGTKVTAVVLSAVGGSYRSSIYVFNLGKPNPVSVTDIDGALLFSIQYIDNDKIAAVSKTESVFLSDDGKKKSVYSYNGKTLKCYANSGSITALVFGTYGTGNSSTIVSLSGSGKVTGNALTKYNLKSVFACDGKLAALTDEGVWHADASCKHGALTAATGDKIAALPFKGNVYVFGLQVVYRYQLPQ